MFEHAACLTSEEKAREQGAAADRQPKFYDKIVENDLECQTEGGIFYEHIIFENIKQSLEWSKYLKYLSTAILYKDEEGEIIHPYYIVKYKEFYGNKTDIVINNITITKIIIEKIRNILDEKMDYIKIMYDTSIHYTKGILYTNNIIPTILALHFLEKSVIYLPKNFNAILLKKIMTVKNKNDIELVVNLSNDNENYPIFDKESPIFLSHKSRILNNIIKMTDNINEFNNNFKLCILFIQLVRCNFFITQRSKSIRVRSLNLSNKYKNSIYDNNLSYNKSYVKRKNIFSLLSLDNKNSKSPSKR